MTAPDWAWAGLGVVIMAWWTVYDFYLCPRYGWVTMSGRFRYYLHETVAGPIVFGVTVMVPAVFLYHIFQTFTKYH
jgi:hypothetical protein